MFESLDDDALRNLAPTYAHLRAHSPVFHDVANRRCALFEYEAVKRALTDHESFSSQAATGQPSFWMIFTDPPRHARLRGLISRAFTSRSVAELEPRIRELAHDLLARSRDGEVIDFVDAFALPLPMMVIAELLGVPSEDWRQLRQWSEAVLGLIGTLAGGSTAEKAVQAFFTASAAMQDYVAPLLSERRSRPGNDLLSRLATAELEGERLSDEEIMGFFQLLLVAGHETTTNLLGNAVLCLIEHPDTLRGVRADPRLLPALIEEVARYRSPVQMAFRKTTRPVEFGSCAIPEGTLVLAMVGSANRDPAVFKEPDRFDVGRNPNPHVAFGHGIHFCVGAPLARLEARVALTEMLARFSRFELTEEGWSPRKSFHVSGPARLSLRVSR